ncbi:MAG: methionyl-tRNA formyltransferase [Ignavibacteriales bacterium]|nr:MAG: methionyl-tRNA formyltransferase [Ignavibacteriales bacterium]
MKIVFMGTPKFAIPSLQKILESKHQVMAVVSAPDKERGRGRQITFSPVKEFALKNKIEVYNPVSLNDPDFILQLKGLQPDLFVVVAFRILPKGVFTIPFKGSFNLHGSLLPKYRGAAPIQWALINGDKQTGVTTFFLEDKIDTGNIILQEKLPIDDEDDFGSLHNKMMILGSEAVLNTIDLIDSGNYSLTKQNDSLASPAPKITKEICEINWNKNSLEIHNLVRGLSPYPGAFFIHNGKNYKVFRTRMVESDQWSMVSGQLNIKSNATDNSQPSTNKIYQTKKEIFIQTKSGVLQILELQPEDRKRMTTEEFLRGYSLIN